MRPLDSTRKTLLLATLTVFSLVPASAFAVETTADSRSVEETSEAFSSRVAQELRYAGIARFHHHDRWETTSTAARHTLRW